MDKSFIKDIHVTINNLFQKYNNEIIKRDRKVSFKDFLYAITYMTALNKSYDMTISHLQINNILNISKSALTEKRNSINCDVIKRFNSDIATFIFGNEKRRLVGADGSNVTLLKVLCKEGAKEEKTYSRMLLSALYDIENNIPINYDLFNNFNEREALISQLSYLRKGDILVMDRGYYSKELLYELHLRSIDYIFRIKDCQNKSKNDDEIKNEKIKNIVITNRYIRTDITRKLKTKKESIQYNFITSLIDPNIQYFKDVYHKRWNIEIDFRYIKYYLSANNIRSKKENNVRQDIYAMQFLNTIISYCNNHLQKNVNNKYIINKRNATDIISNNILKLLFYKRMSQNNLNEVLRIFGYILDKLVKIQKERHYHRIRKRPASKWSNMGCVYIKR